MALVKLSLAHFHHLSQQCAALRDAMNLQHTHGPFTDMEFAFAQALACESGRDLPENSDYQKTGLMVQRWNLRRFELGLPTW